MQDHYSIQLLNWRCFENCQITLPNQKFILFGHNGIGKTSILSGFYSLFTGQPWPETKFSSYLKQGQSFFKIAMTSSPEEWNLLGQVSAAGKLKTKFNQPQFTHELEQVSIITYTPNDNLWLNLSRTSKLSFLDQHILLLDDSFGQEVKSLDKNVKAKSALLKHAQENDQQVDVNLYQVYTRHIIDISKSIWKKRKQFIEDFQDYLSLYTNNIRSGLKDWKIDYQITNHLGQRSKDYNPSYFEEALTSNNFQNGLLFKRECASTQVLFGAHRDDFELISNHLKATEVLSRGEMRLMLLYLKFFTQKTLHENSKKVWWLLDDALNELDPTKEEHLLNHMLQQADYFITTSTTPSTQLQSLSIDDLTNF